MLVEPHSQYIDGIPGSLKLTEEVNDLERSVAHASDIGDVVLDPVPSNDVNDPLNWSKFRKMMSVTCTYVFVSWTGVSVCVIYSLLEAVVEDTGIPLSTLNAGTGYFFLFLGLGGLVMLPLAFAFGNRPVFLFATLATGFMSIWTTYISSEGAWIGMKIISGIVLAPCESLCEVAISQIFFAHERGYYLGLYSLLLFGSNYLAPVLSGFVYDGIGWVNTMRWSAAVSFAAFVFLFFFMEETNYTRDFVDRVMTPTGDVSSTEEKKNHAAVVIHSGMERELVGNPKSFISKMGMFQERWATTKSLFTMMWRPLFLIVRFPVVLWTGFAYGSSLVWYNVLNATESLILSNPPYNFSTSSGGLMYIAALIGVFIGGIGAGWGGDKYALYAARKNGGVREPEQRLILMIIPSILVPSGLIMWGVGAYYERHWILLAFGMGFIGCVNGVMATFTLSYCFDSMRELGGEVIIAVVIVRNCLSFAIGYAISPWLEIGYKNCFISAGFIGMAITLTFIPVMIWGKSWRKSTKEAYWKMVESSAFKH